jgi:quercetin dioxygenase-like cupin family protein
LKLRLITSPLILRVMNTTIDSLTNDGYLFRAREDERIWIVGDTMTIKASANTTGGNLTLMEIESAPGAGPPPHVHIREDEALYVVDGEFEILIGERSQSCGPGAFAFIPRGTVHRFACTSQTTGRILALFTPGGIDGFFREAGRPASDDGPAPAVDEDEISRTNAAGERYGLKIVNWEDQGRAT